MREYLDKAMGWLSDKLSWLPELGRGKYWTLPWGNDGRGTRVYLWPFVCVAIFFVFTLFLGGCSTQPKPYFDVGVGYQIDDNSDWYVRTDRDWQCSDNWQAHFELGLDWGKTTLGYHHQSWWSCGSPFNNNPELYMDDVRLTHRFGGK